VAVGRTVQPALREDGIEADERAERHRERVDRTGPEREPPRPQRVGSNPRERDREQDLLPGLDRSQGRAVDPGAVQRRHDGVVSCQADDPEIERRDRPAPDERRRTRQQHPVDGERERGHDSSVQPAEALDGAPAADALTLVAPRPHNPSLRRSAKRGTCCQV
jgi:hypothetical protein